MLLQDQGAIEAIAQLTLPSEFSAVISYGDKMATLDLAHLVFS